MSTIWVGKRKAKFRIAKKKRVAILLKTSLIWEDNDAYISRSGTRFWENWRAAE